MVVEVEGMVLNVGVSSVSKEGQPYYKAIVMQGMDVLKVSCTEEVAKATTESGLLMKPCVCKLDLSEYKGEVYVKFAGLGRNEAGKK